MKGRMELCERKDRLPFPLLYSHESLVSLYVLISVLYPTRLNPPSSLWVQGAVGRTVHYMGLDSSTLPRRRAHKITFSLTDRFPSSGKHYKAPP